MPLGSKSVSKWRQNDHSVFASWPLFRDLRFAAAPDGPREPPDPQKSQQIIKNNKTNNNCSMPFGSFLCIVQAGGGSSRDSSRQSSRQQSLHSACFSSVVSQRSATISAVNSTCSCQGVEGCGDATPQASSIYTCTYIISIANPCIHIILASDSPRYLARSGTWHDLVPGTTWQIWYLVPGIHIYIYPYTYIPM